MNNFDVIFNKIIKESSNDESILTLNDMNNLQMGDIIILKDAYHNKKVKYHFDRFLYPKINDKRPREILVREDNSSMTIKLPEWDYSGIDLIGIEKNTSKNYEDTYTYYITGVGDGRQNIYAVCCLIGFDKPSFKRIQKKMGERYFTHYYSESIRKSFKSYDSFTKFCSSLNISSNIPSKETMDENNDRWFYLS